LESASKISGIGIAEDWIGEFDGSTVNFVSIRQDSDLAAMLKGGRSTTAPPQETAKGLCGW
jgi:hypothetical protein